MRFIFFLAVIVASPLRDCNANKVDDYNYEYAHGLGNEEQQTVTITRKKPS